MWCVATFLSHNWGNVFHHKICQDIRRSMLDAIPAHTSLLHHYFYFSQHSLLKDLTPSFLPCLASCFSLGAQLILLLLFLVFVKRWNPDTAQTEDWAGLDGNVKITSSDVKIYILFSLNRIYNNTLPPSGITIKSKYCWIHCLNWSSQRSTVYIERWNVDLIDRV